jgi:anti-sigma regulatory factor (Ser/Thr protein kinase)
MLQLQSFRATLTLPVIDGAASRARAFARAELAKWDLPDCEESAVLVVSELVGNVVRHAEVGGQCLELRLRAGDGFLRVEVTDPDPRLPVPRVPGEFDESGFGFVLIEALAAKWGVDQTPAGKAVWAELAISGGDQAN